MQITAEMLDFWVAWGDWHDLDNNQWNDLSKFIFEYVGGLHLLELHEGITFDVFLYFYFVELEPSAKLL